MLRLGLWRSLLLFGVLQIFGALCGGSRTPIG
jgi:hypothetical protein